MISSTHSQRRRGVTLLAAALLAGAVTVSMAGPAFADPTPVPTVPAAPGTSGGTPAAAPPGSITWAVQPSTKDGPDKRSAFTYTNIAPGTVINDYVGVTNFSRQTVTFDVYASDAFNTTSGSLDLLAASEKPKDVGAWAAIPKKTITIEPGARVNEPFTVTVPFNATPGDHVGGVIASVTSQGSDANRTVHVDQRLAVPVYLRVSGALTSGVAVESVSTAFHGTINPFGGGKADVSYTIRNTGNTRLDLTTDIKIGGLFGLKLGSAQVAPVHDLLPGATFRISQRLSGVYPAGPLNARVSANPTALAGIATTVAVPAAVTGEAGLWATPWALLLLLVLIAAVVFGILTYMRRGRERTQKKVAKAVSKARRETVEELTGGPVGSDA